MVQMSVTPSLYIHLFQLPLVLTLFLCFCTYEATTSDMADPISLLSFKSQIKHDPFGVLSSWNNSALYCQWRGVLCGRHHPKRVTAINLNSFSLSGSISPFLANLTFLKSINLASNQLTGQIPHEIGNLHRLVFLNLSLNSISGAVPTSLGNISSLKVIDLRSNQLTGEIPPTLAHLSVLQVLNLRSNLIGGRIMPNITDCRDLQVLSLRSNFFTGTIPLELGYLTKLTQLTLGYNNLSGPIPSTLGELSNLEILDLPFNNLIGSIPSSLGNLSSLIWLDLSYNNINGSIPISFGNLAAILTLQVTRNRLEGIIPPSFGNLSSLQGLGLGSNNIHGEIPFSLGKLSSLVHLECSGNNLSGQIPNSIGQLSSLEFLNLGFNYLTGKLPDSIYNLSSLTTLVVAVNSLEGTLRTDMGDNFPYLEMLRMNTNQLEGPIPASLSNASSLADIELMDNSFTGSIPTIFGTMLKLYYLDISYNKLEARNTEDWNFMISLMNCTGLQNLDIGYNLLGGTMPTSLVNLSKSLNYLAFDNNWIQGNIPSGIGNLVNLTYLDMSNNLLDGVIPVDIGKILRLQIMDLSKNNISGEIPSSLKNLTEMNRLYLSSNNLRGIIPESFGNMLNLELMNLSNNNLVGNIPKEIGSLSDFFDLSHNQLSGTIPPEIGTLRNLKELRLSSNILSGVIPSELGECEILERLYLEMNSFRGTIPSSFSNLRGLQELDLSNNLLTGQIPSFLQELPYLNYLNLSFNNLEGAVPENGVFRNLSEISLRGNAKLCGGFAGLNLPKCDSSSKRKGISNDIKIIVSTIGATSVALLIFLFLFIARNYVQKRKQKTKLLSTFSFKDRYPRVSYDELFRATNGFSVMNLIGTGTFGSVYIGVMDEHDAKSNIAVKVFNLDQYGALKSFFSECEALKTIRHRNLVKMSTSCSSIDHNGKEFKALVFEYMPNGSLDEWLHPNSSNNRPNFKRLSLRQRLNVAIDVASALEYLHHHQGDSPIVHCDMKPSNVLLDDDLTAHVGDFGLAKFLIEDCDEYSQCSSSMTTFKGSIGYVPPEYGMGGRVSIHGDTYSYGILLLELITGRRPTDERFNDHQTLRTYVQAAIPERIMEILDINMLLTDECSRIGLADNRKENNVSENMVKCLILLIECGLLCVNESPKDRPEMPAVLKSLSRASETLAS